MSPSLLIDGAPVAGAATVAVVNPATGAPFAVAPVADATLLDRAVAAGARAFRDWSRRSAEDRAARLDALAAGVEARGEEFARLVTLEQGKTIGEARGEVAGTVAALRWHAGLRLTPRTVRETAAERIIEQRYPLGIVAAIVPWNYPLLLLALKIAPALIAGNVVIAKPAPTTPLATLLLGEVAAPLFPPGVVQVLGDDGTLGPVLTAHPGVAHVSLTGSTATGKAALASAAGTMKRFTLELGGNDPAILLDDADVAAVAPQLFQAAMMNAGQVCYAVKRVYAPRALMDDLCDALVAEAARVVVGDGLYDGTTLGPVHSAAARDRLFGLIAEESARGRVLAGGGRIDAPGYFVLPTIVRDAPQDSPLVQAEQFGPVLPVLAYGDEEEAIALANDCAYGLGASVWSGDAERGFALASRLESGTVWVNRVMDLPFDIPLGGAKQSGIGRHQGIEGVEEYTQARIVNMALHPGE